MNFNVSEGRPRLQHLEVHHGKKGSGLGVDFNLRKGRVTILNMTQSDYSCDTFKLLYTIGEVIEGDILHVGNPNGRLKISKPIPEFIDEWCQQGPIITVHLELESFSKEIEAFAESMGFKCAKI